MKTKVAVITGIVLGLLLLAGPASAQAPPKPKKAPSAQSAARSAFRLLVADTRKLPLSLTSRRQRGRLLRIARRANRLRSRRPCTSARLLRSYNRSLRRVRVKRLTKDQRPTGPSPRGKLQADVLRAYVTVMALPRARRCGGEATARTASTGPTTKLVESDAKHLRLRVSLPSPTFSARQVGGRDFTAMFMEGMGETGDVGKPAIPTATKHFGVPVGADVDLKINGSESYEIPGVELFPHQESPVDLELPKGAPPASTFADKPFEIDGDTYKSDRPYPAQPADAAGLGSMRGLRLGGVDVAGAQYQPDSGTLKVFTSIDVTVNFTGDNKGNFGPRNNFDNKWDVFFNRNYSKIAVNWDAIIGNLGELRPVNWCGEEMLVITSPTLATAAETFRAGKVAQGISTSVRFVGSDPGQIGDTKEEIQAFIRNRLNGGCIIRPTYVVLLGNTAAVPTWLVPCGPGGDVTECDIASDLPYSLDGLSSDLFADVMLGRIPVTDPADADAVVNKILTYQNTPPAPPGDDFYSHATVTGYFQPAMHCVLNEGQTGTPNCNAEAPPVTGHWEINYANKTDTRGFTKTSEAIKNAMNANSYVVDRLFTTDDEDVDPEFYYDGTPIPSYLQRPTFAWDANTTDFLNSYNAGKFLILHRDHGWPDGWAEPTLHSGHVPLFTNGSEQPVVFGINCSSAAFDTPAHPSFVELQVRRIGGGAIAGFGDTRVSPSFPNNHMARGFFDALFPNLQPEFGGDEPTRRLGDVLILGKQFMASMEGVDWHGAGDTYVEHYLYHLLGDPSMQMWAAEPKQFIPPKIDTRFIPIDFPRPGDPPWKVNIRFPPIGGGDPPPFNTVATLLNGGEVIGRTIINAEGFGEIIPEAGFDAKNLQVSFNQQGVLPAMDGVDGVPQQPPPPPAEKQQTSLTLTGPSQTAQSGPPSTFSGKLSPGFSGAKVRIVYTRDDGFTVNASATTDASGSYSDARNFPFDGQTGNTWRARAFFDGDETHLSSQSGEIRFVNGD